jgi:hypothetical protein
MELITKFRAVNASLSDDDQYFGYTGLEPEIEYYLDRIRRQDRFVILELTSSKTFLEIECLLPKQYARVVSEEDIYDINELRISICLIRRVKPNRQDLIFVLYDTELILRPGSK